MENGRWQRAWHPGGRQAGAAGLADDAALGHDARRVSDIPAAGWMQILKRSATALAQDDIWTNCASVGFFGFLSVFPIMAVFVLLYGLAYPAADMAAQIEELRPFMPEVAFDLLEGRLRSLSANSTSDLTIGLALSTLVAMWTGTRGTNSMIGLLNVTYHEKHARGFFRRVGLAIAITLSALMALIVALVALAAIPLVILGLPFPDTVARIALWGRWPILAGMIFWAFLFLYRFAPKRRKARLRWLVPGAALATLLWLALSWLFTIYVERVVDYSSTFGALSAGVVLMLWIYYSAFVIAIGGVFNAEIEYQTAVDTTVGRPRPRGMRGAFVADDGPPVGDEAEGKVPPVQPVTPGRSAARTRP